MSQDVLRQAVIYLCAAVIFVPIAKRLGLGSVLGYLVAGVVIGPWVFNLVGEETGQHHVMHFAEFGVVMMLFVVGLELRPALLWELKKPIVGLGGLQVTVTAGAVAIVGALLGLEWKLAIAVGLVCAMSSTAIVLSSLTERALMKTPGGQSAFSVLLFQDIAVIPILAVFPLLGAQQEVVEKVTGRPAWLATLLTLGAVAAVVLSGRFVIRPLFKFLAGAKVRESFTAAALLIVVGIALLMELVGLSPALGTFLAGVVLADSEYRHELETDIEPFKGLLLGLFFVSVGAQIDFGLIAQEPMTIALVVLGSMVGKLAVLYGLARVFELDRSARWLFAFSLAQIGEFAFVLLTFGVQTRTFTPEFAGTLVAAVALSMVLTPPMFIVLERWVLPAVEDKDGAREQDTIEGADTPVVIAGYGRYGQMVGRMLRANRIKCTILDLDPNIVDLLARLGIKVYYGDASRVDLLHAAGCATAKLFVLAVDDQVEATKIAESVREHFPNLPILARARNRPHYWELKRLGVHTAFRETFGSAYETGIAALVQLGYRAHTAHRLARRWRTHEERALEAQGPLWQESDADTYWAQARLSLAEAERLMRDEDPRVWSSGDAAWNNESLRSDREPDAVAIDEEA